MNNRIILTCIACLFLLKACYKDKSSDANRELTEIEVSVNFDEKETIDLNLNDTFSIDPQIIQKENCH